MDRKLHTCNDPLTSSAYKYSEAHLKNEVRRLENRAGAISVGKRTFVCCILRLCDSSMIFLLQCDLSIYWGAVPRVQTPNAAIQGHYPATCGSH